MCCLPAPLARPVGHHPGGVPDRAGRSGEPLDQLGALACHRSQAQGHWLTAGELEQTTKGGQ